MKILIIHNRYTQSGGEDTVVAAETAALRARGYEVHVHEVANVEPASGSIAARTRTARLAVWSRQAAAEVEQVARRTGAQVAHVHNHAYALSAAIFPALERAGVPVVQTLHNYRMTCANAYLLRDGRPCQDCVGSRASWSGIRHRCFRDSRAGSAMVAGMQLAYRRAALPRVARWIVMSEFARDVYVRAGFPAERLVVRPNTIADPGFDPAQGAARAADAPVLFVGRLEEAKGVRELLEAWQQDDDPSARLELVGSGPLEELAAAAAARDGRITVHGQLDREDVRAAMRRARVLVLPSHSYEGFPMVVLEAFAVGTPALVSDHGALREIVTDDVGWRVAGGDAGALTRALRAIRADVDDARRRGLQARERYETSYAQDVVMDLLELIYADAIAARG